MKNPFKNLTISEERMKEVLDTVDRLVWESYEVFHSKWESIGLWLEKLFFDFGILIKRWNAEALRLKELLNEWHWKKDREEKERGLERQKEYEIEGNINDFCARMRLDPSSETMYKIKEYQHTDWWILVVWMTTVSDRWKTSFWWTTAISNKQTPGLYKKLSQKYQWFYN